MRKTVKRIAWLALALFFVLNVISVMHAWHFTHFSKGAGTKTGTSLSLPEKVKVMLMGVSNPRPHNKEQPAHQFKTLTIQGNTTTECWLIEQEQPKGTVILFHGYGGNKSSLLEKADVFFKLGYSTVLVDFMGSGGSEGNQTTIGFKEAQQVKAVYDKVVSAGDSNIYLFGTSMGAAAVMKAMNDYELSLKGIVLECPFGTLYQTVCARFGIMHVPAFPMAGLLTFWGGIENGFWAFGHNPAEYAKSIHCPVLLMYGEKDEKVSLKEIQTIYTNLGGVKTLRTYPQAGHENYLLKYKQQWSKDVERFFAGKPDN